MNNYLIKFCHRDTVTEDFLDGQMLVMAESFKEAILKIKALQIYWEPHDFVNLTR